MHGDDIAHMHGLAEGHRLDRDRDGAGLGDLGCCHAAAKVAKTRTVTVAIEAMTFRKAVHVGDVVSVHAELVRMGRTSLTVHIEAWVLRRNENAPILVTDGNFTFVSIDENGRPQVIKRPDATIST